MTTDPNFENDASDVMFRASGEVTMRKDAVGRLSALLYTLARDSGSAPMEDLLFSLEEDGASEIYFANGWLARWAEFHAKRLIATGGGVVTLPSGEEVTPVGPAPTETTLFDHSDSCRLRAEVGIAFPEVWFEAWCPGVRGVDEVTKILVSAYPSAVRRFALDLIAMCDSIGEEE